MSGKVKCTCGWSWNKSDSSKKDMYICHECGRDNSNNMKNGGWLDQYADGGTMQEHQENYNDSSVSLPEGFVGEGYDTTGRNYSPAWGGQFQEGGEIPNAQSGRATRADSLAVLNSQLALNKFYDKEVKLKKLVKYDKNFAPKVSSKDIKDLNKENLEFYRTIIKERQNPNWDGKGLYDDDYKKYFNLNSKQVSNLEYKGLGQTKSSNNNKAYYRDRITPQQNLAAPLALIDSRIQPQGLYEYTTVNAVDRYPGGMVSVYNYDPLAVKPFDLLSDKEKQQRVKQYGTDGVPKSYLTKNKTSVQTPTKTYNTPQVQSIENNLRPAGLVEPDFELEADVDIHNRARIPKYYDVIDKVNQNFGGGESKYRWFPENRKPLQELSQEKYNDGTPYNTRTMVPHYQMGGVLPGAVGNMYARTGSPSKGPRRNQTDVTDASAQNGKEMQYYQNGLDWQPKTISRDGSQLDKAQIGTKKFKLKDERDLAYKPAESTNVKKKNFDLEQDKERKNYLSQLADQQKENSRRKKLTQDQREREDYNARNEQTGSIQTPVEESTWDRSKAIASNPLTAFGYAARNESLPARFQYGERNALDTPIDFINPLQGAAALSEIPGELGRGEYLNAGLSALDAADLGVYAKGAMKASKPLLQKTGKALGTESGLLSNTYKHNPWAFKLNESNYYRQVSKEAIDDALSSKLIREKGEVVSSENYKNFQNQLEDLAGTKEYLNHEDKYRAMYNNNHGPMPYFQKGELFYGDKPLLKIREKGVPISERKTVKLDHLIESNYSPENFQNSFGYKMSVGNPVEIGNVGILKPDPVLRNLENFNLYKKDWLQGYKKIPKQEDGGVIKDDNGYWNPDNWGKVVEIGSNDITMKGVDQPLLGISDTGDTKLMKPGKNYKFKGKKVTEYPMAKNGMRQEQKSLQNLDQLTNFTNYNKPQPGGWLNKYN